VIIAFLKMSIQKMNSLLKEAVEADHFIGDLFDIQIDREVSPYKYQLIKIDE
jgi:hypothetical protein